LSDPSLDECNGTLTACKLRHGEGNELPFGGFPERHYQELICVRKPLMRSWRTPQRNIRANAAWWRRKAGLSAISPAVTCQQSRLNISPVSEDYAAAEDWGR
jgi:hypothetical protein